MKTAVLIGHGTFDAGVTDYRAYINDFTDFANINKVDKVIVCGSEKLNPHVSKTEAEYLKKLLVGRLGDRIKVVTETESLNASEAIRNSASLVEPQKKDDITVFCNSTIAVKVMWFIMHYWFKLSREQIEKDALQFVSTHFSQQNGMDAMGKWIGVTGVHYKNVEVHPYYLKATVHSAIAQQLVSLVDVAALYNPPLQKDIIDANKAQYGLKK